MAYKRSLFLCLGLATIAILSYIHPILFDISAAVVPIFQVHGADLMVVATAGVLMAFTITSVLSPAYRVDFSKSLSRVRAFVRRRSEVPATLGFVGHSRF